MELRITNLSKTYANGVQALKNVNLTIPQGMFGLLGPNGAGKSTLMRTISTLQEADTGTITLGDIDVLNNPAEVRKVLGYLPQEWGLRNTETLLWRGSPEKAGIEPYNKMIDRVPEDNLISVEEE